MKKISLKNHFASHTLSLILFSTLRSLDLLARIGASLFLSPSLLVCEHRYRQHVTLRIPRGYSYGYIDSQNMQYANLRMRKGHMETARWSGRTANIAPIGSITTACRLLRAPLLAGVRSCYRPWQTAHVGRGLPADHGRPVVRISCSSKATCSPVCEGYSPNLRAMPAGSTSPIKKGATPSRAHSRTHRRDAAI